MSGAPVAALRKEGLALVEEDDRILVLGLTKERKEVRRPASLPLVRPARLGLGHHLEVHEKHPLPELARHGVHCKRFARPARP